MAHFAKILDNKVIQVIVAEPEFFDSFVDTTPGEWIQTSWNTRKGVHYGPDGNPDGGVALRGNFACIGFIYDRINDVFYREQPYPSWTLNTTTWDWDPPIPNPQPTRENPWDPRYVWDEETQSWIDSLETYYKDLI